MNTSWTRRLSTALAIMLLICAILTLAPTRTEAVSKTVIYRLAAAARSTYADPGDVMESYSMMVYRGKEYATTRGMVKGVPTIAVWEYVPDEWHRIFDYPLSDYAATDVIQRYRAYGFTAPMQKRLLAAPKPLPGH